MAVEHPLAEPREAWFAVIAERDQLAIQGKALEVLRVVADRERPLSASIGSTRATHPEDTPAGSWVRVAKCGSPRRTAPTLTERPFGSRVTP
jgi:hypothetical protein